MQQIVEISKQMRLRAVNNRLFVCLCVTSLWPTFHNSPLLSVNQIENWANNGHLKTKPFCSEMNGSNDISALCSILVKEKCRYFPNKGI